MQNSLAKDYHIGNNERSPVMARRLSFWEKCRRLERVLITLIGSIWIYLIIKMVIH